MHLDDCYRLLDLEPDASDEELRRAHRDLTKIWHPDRLAHDPDVQRRAEEKLKAINTAYDTIRATRAARPSERGTHWRVRMGSDEIAVTDFESLIALAASGRIDERAEIFHPGIARWVPLQEVPELRATLRQGRVRRALGWVFAAALAGLLILLRRPGPAGLLLAGALLALSFYWLARMRRLT